MSLVACTDKRRKHRVNASGDLSHKNYYCPNPKYNAILTLVDCNDESRKDHFRVKSGFLHIENCPYIKEEIYLSVNGFTNKEYQIIVTTLDRCREHLSKLLKELCFKNSHGKIDTRVIDAFKYWLGLNLYNEKDYNKAYPVIQSLKVVIDSYDANKFKLGSLLGVTAWCFPLKNTKIYLSSNFFEKESWDDVKQEGTIIHEMMHQNYKSWDIDILKKSQWFKQQAAENWSMCYEEIARELWGK